ncbi:MAG: single-stranded-DNA-specific exonuclease RecJ [Synechococcales bacterium]|nr:single-stranded-DNA-specific exonuclease RecJ [Synechococcales bacterium]
MDERAWILSDESPPAEFVQWVQQLSGLTGHSLATILWRRGYRDRSAVQAFLKPTLLVPTEPSSPPDPTQEAAVDLDPLTREMQLAIARLQTAWQTQEKVAIWGDFDADGVTATAVLWDGLGQFFSKGDRLTYYIPNRLTESHGLSQAGLAQLAAQGFTLVVTCDTGSTNRVEIDEAHRLGVEIIVTDHHTLPAQRPPVVAIVNPRYLPADHAWATLSGVAVAYKLVVALYQALPQVPQQPVEYLLDLVAIGLVADLVELRGDCRAMAQQGIQRLQTQAKLQTATRPGLYHLLDFCRRRGDRATDIAFGIGPRINAVSRIQGDAHFCVDLLTSRDAAYCRQLAEATELANTRRRALQREVADQVMARVQQLDLSTTAAIVLADPQWHPGVLGLVASQVAQELGRPTLLLNLESTGETGLARGSARSVNGIDLYQLVSQQAHLLHRFGGHPFAAGLSLPIANLPLFTTAINQALRQQLAGEMPPPPPFKGDLQVTVADLGLPLYRELRAIEPCGMGNPIPVLWLKNVWFTQVSHANLKDQRGGKVTYIQTRFQLWDESGSTGIHGTWWGHYREEIPEGRCDVLVELENNLYKERYEVRLVAVRSAVADPSTPPDPPLRSLSDSPLLDWRQAVPETRSIAVLPLTRCPTRWTELILWYRRAQQQQQALALAYARPEALDKMQCWQQLIGIAKYLSRTQQPASPQQLLQKLNISAASLQVGLAALQAIAFHLEMTPDGIQIVAPPVFPTLTQLQVAAVPFYRALQEEQFRRQYFMQVSLSLIHQVLETSSSANSSNAEATDFS